MAVCFLKRQMMVPLKTPWEPIRSLLPFFFLLRGRRVRLSFRDRCAVGGGVPQSQHCHAETGLIAPGKSRFALFHIGGDFACAVLPSAIAVRALSIRQTQCNTKSV